MFKDNKLLYISFIFVLTTMQVQGAMFDNIAPVDPTEVKPMQSNISPKRQP